MSDIIFSRASAVLRKLVIAIVLSAIGLLVGYGCVLLPTGIPLGIVAVAAIVLLWTIPDLQSVPDRASKFMFYVFLFSVLCVPAYFAIILPGMPWLSFRRLALFGFTIPTLIVIASSSSYRRQIKEIIRQPPFAFYCILTFVGVILACIIMSVNLVDSLSAAFNMATLWITPFLAALMFLRGLNGILTLMRFLVFCSIFDCFLGAVESYLHRPFLIYLLPPSMRSQMIASNPLYFTLLQGQGVRNGLYRAASTFNISLSWGEMAAMLAPISLHFIMHGNKTADRVYGIAGFMACFLSIILSGARGAYVGFIAALIIYFILWAIRICRTNPKSLTGPNILVIVAACCILVIGAVLFVGPVRSYVLGSGNTQSSNDARWAEWALAKPKFFESPLWGYGLGTSGTVVGYHPFGSASATVDSYIITGLIEYGAIGLFAITALIIFMSIAATRDYIAGERYGVTGNAAASSLAAFVVYRITLSQQENMTTMVLILATTFLSCRLVRQDTSDRVAPELTDHAAPTFQSHPNRIRSPGPQAGAIVH